MADGHLGIGIIGLGGFGGFLVKQWNDKEDARVVAASDQEPDRAPDESEGIKFYTTEEDLLQDPDVHIVSIATPPSSHCDLALAAISAGKHVLIEKPLALTADDARRIARAAASAGVIAAVNFMLRYNPLVAALKQIIERGVFGKVRRVDLRNYATQDTVPEGHWFWDRKVSGGILIEHGVHFFDMASWLLGSKADEVKGLAVERKAGMEDRVFAAVRYESGAVGTFWHSFSRPMDLETTTFQLAFDLGEIDVQGWVPLSASYWGWTSDDGLEVLRTILPDPAMRIERLAQRIARSSEFEYAVSHAVRGHFALPKPKLDVYGDCLRSIMRDIVQAIRDPNHSLRVTAEDGVAAVQTAELASADAHKN